jgi:hypothetical protein
VRGAPSMRQSKALRRGRVISVLVAGGVGYLIGSWNSDAVRSAQSSGAPTAAQTVALRFPQDMREAPVVLAAALERRVASASPAVREADLALFESDPMAPQQSVAQEQIQPPAEETDIAPLPPATPAAAPPRSLQPKQSITAKPRPPAPRQANRPRYMLDDAQIASIKRRLRLTPDQEQMWPAVEAALRNIGVERERQLHARGNAGVIDPDSPEVQDLKSAAIPLLMSFSDEQKDEVRSLARGMGLDRLASAF